MKLFEIDQLRSYFVSKDRDNAVAGDVHPTVHDTYDLGEDTRRWKNAYVENLYATNITGGGAENADTVDGFHASATPTPNYLLALDGSAKFSNSALYTGHGNGLDADTVDTYHGSQLAVLAENEVITGAWEFDNNVKIRDTRNLQFGTAIDQYMRRYDGNDIGIHGGFRSLSPDYQVELSGWHISYDGNADFRYIFTDELHAKAFIADIEQALAGGQIIAKSVAILSRDFTVPATTGTLYVEDLPGFPNVGVFASGDWVRMRVIDRSGGGLVIENVWGTVSSYTDLSGGEQSWTFTKQSGTTSSVVYAGAVVIDYGTSGQGYWEVTTVNPMFSPYARIVTWSTNPYTPANHTVRTVMGKLDGITDPEMTPTGWGFYSDNAYLNGRLVAVDGDFVVDSDGLRMTTPTTITDKNSFMFYVDGTTYGQLYGYYTAGFMTVGLKAQNYDVGGVAQAYIGAVSNPGGSPTATETFYRQDQDGDAVMAFYVDGVLWVEMNTTSGFIETSKSIIPDAGDTLDLGASGTYFNRIYVREIHADTISGDTIGGQTWEFLGNAMYIYPNTAAPSVVYIANPDATYQASLNVEGNITLGGTVDGVEVGTFYTSYTTHIANANAHHNRSHGIISSSDHIVSGSAFDLIGLSATNTLGVLTPSASPGGTEKILKTTSAGLLTLQDLTVTGTFTGEIDVTGTSNDTFTINDDLNDASVQLIFGRTTGGNANLTYAGVGVQTDKPFAVNTAPLAQMGMRVQHVETVETYGYGLQIYEYQRVNNGGGWGFEASAYADTAGITIAYLAGGIGRASIQTNADNVTNAYGLFGDVYSATSYADTITTAAAVTAQTQLDGGNVTSAIGLQVTHNNLGAIISNLYGVKVNAMAGVAQSAANAYALHTYDSNVVFNESGHPDADFRVEGDTTPNLLFVDASENRVGINHSNPAYALDVGAYSGNIRLAADNIGMLNGSPTANVGLYVFDNGPTTLPDAYTNVMYLLQNVNAATSSSYGGSALTAALSITGSAGIGITISSLGAGGFSISNYQALTVSNITALSGALGHGAGVAGTFSNAHGVASQLNANDGSIITGYLFKGDFLVKDGDITNAYGLWLRPYGLDNGTGGNIALYEAIRLESPNREVTSDFTITNYTAIKIIEPISGMVTGNYNALVAHSGNVILNENGDADSDFRVEGSTYTYMLFVDASDNVIGINNNTPSYTLDVVGNLRVTNATNQLLLTYDGTYHSFFNATSTGGLEISTVTNIILDPASTATGAVLPGGNIEDDLGAYNVMWRSFYAAELIVQNFVQQDVQATIGGAIRVAPTTSLTRDLSAGATTIYLEHAAPGFVNGTYIIMQGWDGDGNVSFEAMQLTSAGVDEGDDFSFTVTRNLDATGANNWAAGTAVVSTGDAVGEGHIDLTSTQTLYGHNGPTIALYSRDSVTNWDDVTPIISLGNLNGFLGYSADTYGLAIGNDLSLSDPTDATFRGLTATQAGGVKLYNVDLELYDTSVPKVRLVYNEGILVSSGTWHQDTTVFAAVFADDATVTSLDAGDVIIGTPFHTGTVKGLHWDNSGATLTAWGDFHLYGNSVFEGIVTIAAAGELRQGTGTWGVDFTGLRIWNDTGVGRIGGYNDEQLQWYGGTDGRLWTGAGNVVLDYEGIHVVAGGPGMFFEGAGFTWGKLMSGITDAPYAATYTNHVVTLTGGKFDTSNLAVNSDFETGDVSWTKTASSGSSATISSGSPAHSGSYRAVLAVYEADLEDAYATITSANFITSSGPGNKYEISFWYNYVYVSGQNPVVDVKVHFYNSSDVLISTWRHYSPPVYGGSQNTWIYRSVLTSNAPTGTAKIKVAISGMELSSFPYTGQWTLYIDDVVINEVPDTTSIQLGDDFIVFDIDRSYTNVGTPQAGFNFFGGSIRADEVLYAWDGITVGAGNLVVSSGSVTATSVSAATVTASGDLLVGSGVSVGDTGYSPATDTLHIRGDGSTAGLFLGANSDVQLYRWAADVLRTPDTLQVGGDIYTTSMGTYTATVTGLTTSTASVWRKVIGKLIVVWFVIAGTKNGSTGPVTFTLPATHESGTGLVTYFMYNSRDNFSYGTGRGIINSGGTVVTLYKDDNTTGFTANAAVEMRGHFVYESA